ncbi:MAG: hypothetical protein KAZ71_02495 [Bacteroidia bacterium]|jgi:hypothetical protein|nr:hypothetical protein [Bacteroidia bacterium]
MKLKLFFATFALGLITLGINSSCQKKTDCKLIVTIHDSVGNAVSAATVKLFANVKTASGSTVEADLKAEGVSDGGGTSTYTFKLPAILDVKVVAGTKTGIGIVKLEEGKTVEKIITVK